MLNRFQMTFLAAVAIASAPQIGLASSESKGEANAPSQLTLKTERVCVFKDGHCMILKRGTAVTDKDGFVFTDEVPDAAVLGSFWAVPEQGKLQSMTAGWVQTKSATTRTETCTKVIEIIKANIGKPCKFTRNNNTTLEGTIHKVLEVALPTTEHSFPDAETARQSGQGWAVAANALSGGHSGGGHQVVQQTLATHFVLGTDNGDMLVAASDVNNLLIRGMNSELARPVLTFEKRKRLTMRFAKANAQVNLSIMYFRPGVRWIPTYRVNLAQSGNQDAGGDRNLAELILQGEILNEAEDLIDVPISLVVGVPNFRFKTVPSPLTLESNLRNLLAQAAPNLMSQSLNNNGFSNSLYTQRASEFRSNQAGGSEERSAVNMPEELTTSAGNDLFVYDIEAMTLKKGERATVPILSTDAEYRDVYTWDVDVKHSESFADVGQTGASPLRLSENRVWRQIELINNTTIPWTTGAAMFVDGFQPVAQELLTYTSPGGICRVPVTISVDLRGKIVDQETHRDPNAVTWQGRHYARVKGQIEVELANNKMSTIPVEIRLRVGGKALKATNEGNILIEAYRQSDWQNGGGDRINNSSVITWKADIEPGECFKPTTEYEFLIRR